jgi:hypothetical protein
MIPPFSPAVYFLSSLYRSPKGEDLPVAKYFLTVSILDHFTRE